MDVCRPKQICKLGVNKMKKTIIGLMMLVLMASIAVAGITMPHPIYGTITTEDNSIEGLEVRVTNLDTGANSIVETNDAGFYQADLGNIDDRYHDGDVVEVSIVYCETIDRCSQTVVVSGGGNSLSFDIASGDVTDIPDDAVIVQPIVQPQPITNYVCADGTIVSDKASCIEDSPEKSNSWIAWVIGIFCALFAAAGGWKFYNGKFKHYHRGIKSYHDPNTQHSNEKYRHKAFNKDPIGCINQVAKIQKGIDLSEE